jgi:hypothetical protein
VEDVFIGSEALASGALTRGQLRWNYRPVFRGVYLENTAPPQFSQRAAGAWLWSKRRAVIAGVAAAALHGARIDGQAVDVELIWRCGRPPPGVMVRNERIGDDEITQIAGLPVTTAERTAFDLGRHLPRDAAVIHLDALARATGLPASDVESLIDRYRGARAIRRAIESLALMDGGSRSARETLTRLALIDGGLPPPKTDFTVTDGSGSTSVAMGYEAPMVGVVFGADGSDQHDKAGWRLIHAANAVPLAIMVNVRMTAAERGYPSWRLRL